MRPPLSPKALAMMDNAILSRVSPRRSLDGRRREPRGSVVRRCCRVVGLLLTAVGLRKGRVATLTPLFAAHR